MSFTYTATNLLDALKEQALFMREHKLPPGAWIAYEFLARHGRIYEPRSLPKRYKYRMPKRCFKNTLELVSKAKGLRYVEGYIALRKMYAIPVQHAWAIDGADRVVDPTIQEPQGWEYCGIPMSLPAVHTYMAPGGFGVFDTGVGMNLKYFHSVDPGLAALLPEAVAEHLRSLCPAKSNQE